MTKKCVFLVHHLLLLPNLLTFVLLKKQNGKNAIRFVVYLLVIQVSMTTSSLNIKGM